MSTFKRGDTVLYNGSEPGIIIDVNFGDGDNKGNIDYDVELNNGDIIKTFSNKLKLKTRLEDLKQKKENGTLSPDERKEYLQLSLDNNKKQYTNKMAKIEDNSGGGKRKTIKAKKRKTRKGKKIRKRSQRR